MKRVPVVVLGYLSSAGYLAVLGAFYAAKGRPVSAACVAAVALAVVAPVLRIARRG